MPLVELVGVAGLEVCNCVEQILSEIINCSVAKYRITGIHMGSAMETLVHIKEDNPKLNSVPSGAGGCHGLGGLQLSRTMINIF